MTRARYTAALLGPSLLLAACTASVSGDGNPGRGGSGVAGAESTPGTSTPSDCGEVTLSPRGIRALNGIQYSNSVRALLPSARLKNPFAASDRSSEFSTNAGLRRFDFNATQVVMENAEAAATTAKAQLSTRLPCLAGTPDRACIIELVKGIGSELYHEPLTEPVIAKLVALFDQNVAAGPDEAATLVVRALLSSPRFLFRKELGQPSGSGFRLTSHEVASAIAFTLTDAPPDAALLRAASADQLQQPAQIRDQVLRLLASDAGVTGLRAFFIEYLKARDFATVAKSVATFPLFDATARTDALADFQDTITLTLRSPTPTLTELLTTRQFVVRPGTAALLGWDAQGLPPGGSVQTSTEPGRIGLLTHPVVMATLAHQDETNPVARGHLVSDKLLCLSVPPPPKAVMFPVRSTSGPPKTLRQTLTGEHSVGGCAACHQLMDPMGWPFEAFDAVGRFRTMDAGLPLDTTGNIPNRPPIEGPVANAEELITKVAGSDTAHACFTRHVFRYVAGIDDAPSLECRTRNLAQSFRQQGGSIPELIVAALQSDLFLLRGEAQ